MKKIMWAISCISLIVTAIVLQFMPESVPMHYDMVGNIDRWGSKYENLIFPIIILFISLFLTLIMGYFDKKALKATDEKESAGAKSNTKVLSIVGVSMAAMFTVIQGFILYVSAVSGATEQAVDIGKVFVILMGVIFIVLGNFMTKTRINGTLGVRVNWSMYNDNTWRKSNRFGAFAIMIAGVLTIILAVFMKNSFGATMGALGLVIMATIVTIIYAHKVYIQEIEAKKGGK